MIQGKIQKHMNDVFDINVEYNKLHGAVSKHRLFDDEEYELLREIVLSESKLVNNAFGKVLNIGQSFRLKTNNHPLPFDGIRLIQYKEWRLNSTIEQSHVSGRRMYYLRKEENGNIIAYAAGYYDKNKDGGFIVLGNSFFPKGNYMSDKSDDNLAYDYWPRDSFYLEEKGFFIEKKAYHRYSSASKAAKLYLGGDATFAQWKNKHGISLSLDSNYIEPNEKEPASLIESGQIKLHSVVTSSVHPIQEKQFENVICEGKEKTKNSPKKYNHLFFISDAPHCQASGYYSQEDDYFYICEGSIVSEKGVMLPNRQRFNDKACIKIENGWRVIKDAKCKNASVAAYYVTGRLNDDYTMWRDSNGKYLKDYFPKKFFIGGDSLVQSKIQTRFSIDDDYGNSKPIIKWEIHFFYIKSSFEDNNVYDATGFLDPQTFQFTIKEGSLISKINTTTMFKQSAIGFIREEIIKNNCLSEKNGFRLISDEICKNPIYAASIVMGKTINGWEMWKDNKGKSISYYL